VNTLSKHHTLYATISQQSSTDHPPTLYPLILAPWTNQTMGSWYPILVRMLYGQAEQESWPSLRIYWVVARGSTARRSALLPSGGMASWIMIII
jgi:hypothetical protein